MLPFAIGAAAAAVVAFLNGAEAIQLGVFLIVSAIALYLLRNFVKRGDQKQPNVGANRFVGQRARVIGTIGPATGLGRVKMDTELWRATTDGVLIPEGTAVRVTEVRGTRLAVEPPPAGRNKHETPRHR